MIIDTEKQAIIEIINDFFGCDAAYFDVNPFDLATHLMTNGVRLIVPCKDCENWDVEYAKHRQGWCPKVVGYRSGTWFCAAGKRSTETENK